LHREEEQEEQEEQETSLFDEFWSIYPRKVGKDRARRAFEAALKRAEAEAIVQGALKYRHDAHRIEEPEFTAHPTTWLNQDRWIDELDVVSSVREVELIDLTKRFDNEPEGISFAEWFHRFASPEEQQKARDFGLGKKFA
jgi:hypothetical protein